METTDTLTADTGGLSTAAMKATDIADRFATRSAATAPTIPPVVPAATRFSDALVAARQRQTETAARFADFYRSSSSALSGLGDALTERESATAARFTELG
jgi:hypothetical protein